MEEWYADIQVLRYDFYRGLFLYLKGGNYEERMKEMYEKYSDITLIPRPDVSFRTYKLKNAILINSNLHYNETDYLSLICGKIINEIVWKPHRGHKAVKWCLAAIRIHKESIGKYVEVGSLWVFPLPELTGKQMVSLIELRACIPTGVVFADQVISINYVKQKI